MKNEKKTNKWVKIIFLCLIIFIIGGTVIVSFSNKDNQLKETKDEKATDNNLKYNTNENIIEDKVINDISFKNIECSFDGNNSLLEYTITNHSDKEINLGEYEIIIKDKKDNILAILAPVIDYVLKPNESYDTGNAIDIDLSEAASLELNLSVDE